MPALLALIVRSAFGLEPAAGGMLGALSVALLNGVKRGLFSNEAGMGSAPNIAAAATPVPHHPSSQGLVQAFGVYVDTLLVCTATALMILLSGAMEGSHEGDHADPERDGRTLRHRGARPSLRSRCCSSR